MTQYDFELYSVATIVTTENFEKSNKILIFSRINRCKI